MSVKKMFAGLAGVLVAVVNVVPVATLGATVYSDELQAAYGYAKANEVTTMSTIDNANMYGQLTRGQLAKMISNWAEKELDKKVDETLTCSFTDANTAEGDLATYVKKSCQMGLMGQGIEKFRPNDVVTRGEFGTTLSRAIWGDKYNTSAVPFYKDHLNALKDAGIMTNISSPDAIEMRGWVMLMLMRAASNLGGLDTNAECKDPMTMLACVLELDTCPAACKKGETETPSTGDVVKAGDLDVSVADYSTSVKSVPMVGISIFNAVKFAASEDVTVNAVTLERVGLSSRSDIKGVWFEKDGVAVSSRGTVATDGKVSTNFNRGFVVKANETLDLVVELSGSNAGSEIAFKFIGVDSTAKNATYNTVTTTYRTANYTVAALDVKNVGGTGKVTYKLGNQKEFVIGQFRVGNQAGGDDKDVFVKSVTFRNAGTADVNSLLKNIKVLRDNAVVSKSVVADGRTVTITLEDTIAAGKSTIYTIMGEVAALERVGDTVQFELRKDRDFVAYEKATNFRTSVKEPAASDWLLKEYAFEGGRVILSNTAGFAKTVEAGSGAADVVIADGTLTVSEPIKLPKISLTGDSAAVRSLVLEIGGSRYSATVNGDTFSFEDIYVNKTAPVKLLASIQANVTASDATFTPAYIGSAAFVGNGEYTNNQENLDGTAIAGSIQIAKIMVKEPSFTLRNTASTTQKIVKGEAGERVIFDGTMSAKSDINVTEMTLSGLAANTAITSPDQIDLFLYVNDEPVANATYKGDNVVFNNIGTAGKDAVKVKIVAQPTMQNVGDFTFAVQAKGTDANGNSASTAAVNTVKLSVVDSANVSLANATTTSSVVVDGTNADLSTFTLTAKNGAVNVTGLTVNFSGAADSLADNTQVTLELAGEVYTKEVNTQKVVFNDININLTEGAHTAKLTANVNTDADLTGKKVTLKDVVIEYDGVSTTGNLGAKYYFVKGYPTLALVKSADNELRVRITNGGEENITIIGYTADNATTGATTLNGQTVADSGTDIEAGKQVTLSKGQSTELKLAVSAAGVAKLTGIKYTIVNDNDSTNPYTYTVTTDYTNNATWGDLMVTYKS